MKIRVISPGLLTTVQDLGRRGWRSDGVPLSGAADVTSHRLANFMVGNEAGAATLEIAGGGFSAQTEIAGWLAVCGAGGQFSIGRKETGCGRLVFVPKGTILEIRPGPGNNYAYLAVQGGWDVPEVLDSKSTCLAAGFGGWEGRGLRQGDMLKAAKASEDVHLPAVFHADKVWVSPWFVHAPSSPQGTVSGSMASVIRVLPGPEIYWWSAAEQEEFFTTLFSVSSRRDRMGVRLENNTGREVIQKWSTFGKTETMLSTAIGPGAIQVPPDGHPFVLLADAQTTGGYPRIAQVIAVDIPRLAQMPPGQTVHFQKVALEEAERLFFEQENMLRKTQLALHWRLASISRITASTNHQITDKNDN